MRRNPEPLLFGGEEAGQGGLDEARVVVLPAPLELTVSYGTGAGAAPGAILRASAELELFDEETGAPYWGPGEVHTLEPVAFPGDPEGAVAAVAGAARPAVDAGKLLLTLGGEHTVSAGALRAGAARHPGLGVLLVDAHLDLRESYQGSRWSHACVARRILDEQPRSPIVWCGTRALSAAEAAFARERRLPVFFAHDLDGEGRWIEEVAAALPDEVYLSIDADALDPGVMPGTGTPEPGGLGYRQLLALIRVVARRRRIVAADIVEVAPIPGQQVSEFTAARIAAKLIGAARAAKWK